MHLEFIITFNFAISPLKEKRIPTLWYVYLEVITVKGGN